MFDLMDFEVELRQGSKPVNLVVFFVGPDILTDTQAAHALQKQLPGYVMPDVVVFLMPKYTLAEFKAQQADPLSPLMAELSRRAAKSAQTYGCAFFDEHGVITEFEHLSGTVGRIPKLITSKSASIVKAGLAELVKRSNVLKKAPAGFFYSKPSSRASNYFIRAEDLLSETLHTHYLALACLPLIKKAEQDGLGVPDTIYLDTIALLPLALSLQLYLSRFNRPTFAHIRSFHSHEGLIQDGPLANGVRALCLISASTRCGLAQQWSGVHRAHQCRVTTLLSFEGASSCCTILHTLKQPADFEMLAEGESDGIRLIRIHGERFVADHSEAKFLNIGTDHAPDELQTMFYSFIGKDLFSCYANDRPGTRYRSVYVDKERLVATEKFVEWFDQVLLEEAVASTTRVIYENDNASKGLADVAVQFLTRYGLKTSSTVSFDDFDASDEFNGSVIVIAAAAERGSRLQSVSRRLRTAQQSGTRLYIVGALFGRSHQMMSELVSNLTQPSKGHSRYVVKEYMRIPAAERACTTHWEKEQLLLDSLCSVSSKFSPAIAQRMSAFDNASLFGLSNDPFWRSSQTKAPMKISRGFAFVDTGGDVRDASSTDIFLTILWILQNARYSSKVQNAKRLESGELQQVLLSPELFSRFDDGVIQAAFLRAALPTELDYRAHEAYSLSMSDIILRVAAGYGYERGEAAMEFVMALAISKIRLHKEVDADLRKNLIITLTPHVEDINLLLDPSAGPVL